LLSFSKKILSWDRNKREFERKEALKRRRERGKVTRCLITVNQLGNDRLLGRT